MERVADLMRMVHEAKTAGVEPVLPGHMRKAAGGTKSEAGPRRDLPGETMVCFQDREVLCTVCRFPFDLVVGFRVLTGSPGVVNTGG